MKSMKTFRLTSSYLFGVLIVFALNFDSLCQEIPNRFGIGIIGSSIKMIGGKLDRSTIDQWTGLQLNYTFSSSFNLTTCLAYGWVYPKDPDGSHFKAVGNFKTILLPLNVTLNYDIIPLNKIRPYFSLGTGFTIWDIRKFEGKVSTFSSGKSLNGSQITATIIGGVGVEFFLTPDHVLNIQGNYHRMLKGGEDTIGFGDDGNKGIVELRLGISYYFGGFKDHDKDGIEDKFDLDPLRPEDFDGFEDHDGAPDPDNDNDGIPDTKDKAPNEPEDIDGFEDDDGIPDPDNDGDTIEDENDKCPNMPEDFDGFEDQDGCPDFDNDKDGIPDSLDQCPNWAEDYNGYLDEDGCPDEKPEPEPEPAEIGKNIILQGVNFGSGSARLTPQSFGILDEIVQTLSQHPNMEIEIRGYTDNTGSFGINQQLSQQRAFAVRKYLIDHGISPRRVKAVGMGERDPIASNLTREGRAANRRIEFVRIR